MEFSHLFINALQSNPSLAPSLSITDYLPPSVITQPSSKIHLPFPLAMGSMQFHYPYTYALSNMDAYCILLTESGSGTLYTDGSEYILSTQTIAFIDCKKKHKIEIKSWPWQYSVIFLKGELISFFYDQFTLTGTAVHKYPTYSNLPSLLNSIMKTKDFGIKGDISRSLAIHNLLAEMILEKIRLGENVIPEYLYKIKYRMETEYNSSYSLNDFEIDYNISKYCICREFSKHFHQSPMQYLNKIRILEAKKLIIGSNQRVNEIGHMVGIENTNHFIRLFKKETGVTPLLYRKQSPVTNYTLLD